MEEDASQIVDWALFQRSRTELGPGFVRILGYFREDGEKSVARIEDAMQRKDVAGLVLPSHTLKSEARQFGAEPLGELAEQIEVAARRAIEQRLFPDDLIPTVARLRPLYRETMELFEKEINPRLERRSASGDGDAANQSFGRI